MAIPNNVIPLIKELWRERIAGFSETSSRQLDDWLEILSAITGNPIPVDNFGSLYKEHEQIHGLKADALLALTMVETQLLDPNQPSYINRNPGALFDQEGNLIQFETWEQGVHEQFLRLEQYAFSSDNFRWLVQEERLELGGEHEDVLEHLPALGSEFAGTIIGIPYLYVGDHDPNQGIPYSTAWASILYSIRAKSKVKIVRNEDLIGTPLQFIDIPERIPINLEVIFNEELTPPSTKIMTGVILLGLGITLTFIFLSTR